MEWENQECLENQRDGGGNGNVNGVMYVKVMTDEQLETLRKQIAVYASICEQLVEMHKTLSAQQDLSGLLFKLIFFFVWTILFSLGFCFLISFAAFLFLSLDLCYWVLCFCGFCVSGYVNLCQSFHFYDCLVILCSIEDS